MEWEKDVHATGAELFVHDLGIFAKGVAILAAAYIFFGKNYLPETCTIEAVVRQPAVIYLAIAALAALMGKFTTYGVSWTPFQRKYEFSQAGFSLVLAVVLIAGAAVNGKGMDSIMWFTGILLGLMLVLEFFLDFIGRLVRRRRILAARPPATA